MNQNQSNTREQGQQREAMLAEQRVSYKRRDPVDQNDPENHKKCIFFRGAWHHTVKVETPQLPPNFPTRIAHFRMTGNVRRVYLKMTQNMGMGTFADEDMFEGDTAAFYNGEFRDLAPGETRGNTAADFGAHLQAVTLYGGVQGRGNQVVDGSVHGDYDIDFFVEEGVMSFMNSCRFRSMEHNVDAVVWPRLDTAKVSMSAVDSPLLCLQEL